MRNLNQGETVNVVAFLSTGVGIPLAIPLLNANGEQRFIKSYERLIIDRLFGDATVSTAPLTMDLFASTTTVSTVTSTSFVARMDQNAVSAPWAFRGGEEGFALPVGAILAVWAYGSSGNNNISKFVLSGSARIVEGTTQGVRPAWREAMVRGD